MIRLLALDIDDTLVNASRCISDGNRTAIAYALSQGVHVTVATGRGFLGSKAVRELLGLQAPSIVYGGAMVVDAASGETLHAAYLNDEDIHICFSIADRYGLHAQVYEGDAVIFRAENAFTRQYTGFLHLPFRVEPDLLNRPCLQTPKVLMYVEPDRQTEFLHILDRELPNPLHALTSKPGFLEVGRKDCTKGTALQWLASYLHVDRSEVAAIGDNTLDMDMIQWAGIGCCVANGNAAVKAVSDVVLPACDDDGVASFIRTYIPDC